MLGQALALAWGGRYEDVLQAQVLEPLGMNKTTVGISGSRDPEGLAPGHHEGEKDGWLEVTSDGSGWSAAFVCP